jgi:HEAT repeat protein
MKLKLTMINLWIVLLALLTPTGQAYSQQMDELIDQLTGKAQAPQRDAAQLTQAYQKAIDYLLPLMSADDVGSRFNPQITFQNLGSYASRPGAEAERQILAKVIFQTLEQRQMPDTVRHWFVLQIERIGKGESVPALAKLMASEDKNLRDYARRALEKNPDPATTEVLLKELANAKEPAWKIGLINSLGQRNAESAIPQIAKALDDPDEKIAAAAVTALSNIGGKKSIQALISAIEKPNSPIYQKASQGLMDIAGEMAANKNTAAAAEIYETLYENATKAAHDSGNPNPFNIRAAAVNGLIICKPERGIRELVTIMQEGDPKTHSFVIQAARLSPGMEPVQALGKMLPKLDPDAQVQVLGVIGDRRDLSSINYVKELLHSDAELVRLAAVDTMTKLADALAAESLFDIAVNGSDPVKEAAYEGLALMKGPSVEVLIKAKSLSGDAPSRVTAIGVLGQRHVSDAEKSLLLFAAEDNEDTSAAAFSALTNFADSVDIATLVNLLAHAKSNKARSSGVTTLRSILAKTKDKDNAAKIIIAQMEKTDSSTKLALITTLDALGGPAALKTVTEAAQSSDENTRNAGIRTLSNWPDYEAAKILLDIASNPDTSLTHYVLATRGALRLIQNNESAPLDERTTLCIQAFDNARRDEEKRQAIAVMAFLPDSKAADKLLELVKDENFKAEAGLAAVQLAAGMLGTDRQTARDLAQKILDLNISEDINRRAESVINGRGFRFGGFRDREFRAGSRRRQ